MTVLKRCGPSFKVMELHCFGYRDKRPGKKDVVKLYSTSSTEGKGGATPPRGNQSVGTMGRMIRSWVGPRSSSGGSRWGAQAVVTGLPLHPCSPLSVSQSPSALHPLLSLYFAAVAPSIPVSTLCFPCFPCTGSLEPS